MTPAQPISTQDPQALAAQPTQNDSDSSMADESAVAGSVNLSRAYSKLNSAIISMADNLGVRRSATIPHQKAQSMADHIEAVGQILSTVGGITKNILAASDTRHSPTGGETVAYPSDKLKETIIPSKSEDAIKAIAACRSFVSKVESLVGETPEVQTAKSQLKLIGRHDGEGMTAYDLTAGLLSIPGPLIALVARAHSFVKHGEHHPALTAPKP